MKYEMARTCSVDVLVEKCLHDAGLKRRNDSGDVDLVVSILRLIFSKYNV